MFSFHHQLEVLSRDVQSAGGRLMLVGGAVRDFVLGLKPKDFDFEVFGLEPSVVAEILTRHSQTPVQCQANFPVFKARVNGLDIDVALPRREVTGGSGARNDFAVSADPHMSLQTAASRRDFTMNAMMRDMVTGQVFDFFGGQEDLSAKVIRPIDPAVCAEDSSRILRAAQFAARFDLTPHASLAQAWALMNPAAITTDLMRGEMTKLFVKGVRPSRAFELLCQVGALAHFSPELHALIGVPQPARFHPEGDAFVHSLLVADAMVGLLASDVSVERRLLFVLAALLHDLGKATTTVVAHDGRITAHNHDVQGVAPAKSALLRWGFANLVAPVTGLIANHMAHTSLGDNPSDKAVRRLADRLHRSGRLTISDLALVVHADHAGRPPLPPNMPPRMVALSDRARALGVWDTPLAPRITGRTLISLGLTPSPAFGLALSDCFSAQVDGTLDARRLQQIVRQHFGQTLDLSILAPLIQ